MKSRSEASAHCRSSNSEDDRVRVGEALEEQTPGGEQVLPVARFAVREPEQLREPRLDEAALVLVEQLLAERLPQLRERRFGRLVLGDPAAHPHHVGERPVGDSLAVGEAAAAVPPDLFDDPVEVLVELPAEARLADACDARYGDELRALLVGAGVEELLDPPQLAVAADERRLEPLRAELAADARDHAQRAPERQRLGLSFQNVLACRLVGDRALRGAPGRLADVDGPGVGGRLDPGRGVHQVARDHAFARRSERHGCLAGQHTGAGAERCAELVAERRHRGDEVQGRADGTLRVVLGRGRRAPDGHHGVADELLDRAAVERDQAPAVVEVAGEDLADVLGVARSRRAS